MRRRDPIRIGDALDEFFRNSPLIQRKLAEARVPEVWPEVAGNRIAAFTDHLIVERGGRLFVYMLSAVARHEVFMRRDALRIALNQKLGAEIIRSVIVK